MPKAADGHERRVLAPEAIGVMAEDQGADRPADERRREDRAGDEGGRAVGEVGRHEVLDRRREHDDRQVDVEHVDEEP
jgi:hypothetical protein